MYKDSDKDKSNNIWKTKSVEIVSFPINYLLFQIE